MPSGLLDPTDLEAVVVQDLTSLTRAMLKIGAQKLLYGENPLVDLIGQANAARGAMSPTAARETLTRQAIRKKEERRRAYRSGLTGLQAAIAAG